MKDTILKKAYEGTFSGGQGPVLGLKFDGEGETKGVFGGEMKHLSVEKGSSASSGGSEEKGFSLSGTSYAGPENMKPTNDGVCNPDDISHESKGFIKGK